MLHKLRFYVAGGAALLLAGSLVACSGEPTSTADQGAGVRARHAVQNSGTPECPACIFGPRVYTRTTAKPVTETSTFAGDPAASYVIDIDDGGSQGADGSVVLNGVVLLAPRTSTDVGPRHVHQAVSLLAANTLVVRLTGKPGSTLTVSIEDVTVPAVAGTFLIEQAVVVPRVCEQLAILKLPAGTSSVIVPACSGQGDLSVDGAQIVYWRPFDNRIFRAAADGSGEVVIASGAINYSPRWNSTGDRLVFTREVTGGAASREIFTMNPDGSAWVRLTSNGWIDEQAHISPDGTRIVFASERDGNPEIYVMNSDGSGQLRLTTDPGYDGLASWSPDGSRIAFTSNRSGAFEIYTMAPDGSAVVQVTSSSGALTQIARWSPDGQRLSFQRTVGGVTAAWTARADGTDPRLLRLAPAGVVHEYVVSWRAP